MRTARAKGASEWRVLRKHVLRNALMPVVAMLSMDMVVISLTGVIFIETVFQLPGIGTLLYRSLTNERPAGDPRHRDRDQRHGHHCQHDRGHRLLPPRSAGRAFVAAAAARLGHEPVASPGLSRASPRRLRRAEPVRPGVLVVRARAGADDGLSRLAALEEDRRRDREHVVARGRRAGSRRCSAWRTRRVPRASRRDRRGPARPPCTARTRAPRSRSRQACSAWSTSASNVSSVISRMTEGYRCPERTRPVPGTGHGL